MAALTDYAVACPASMRTGGGRVAVAKGTIATARSAEQVIGIGSLVVGGVACRPLVAEPGAPRVEDDQDTLPGWRDAPLTVGIMAVCTVVFVASWGHCVATSETPWWTTAYRMDGCPASLDAAGGLWLGRLWVDGQWWRVVTAGFAHGSWIHWGLNTWSLFVVGPWAERAWGWRRSAVLFLASSIGGCLASAAWVEAPLVVGASAGILGLAVAVWVARGWGSAPIQALLEPVSVRGLGITLLALVALGFFVPVVAQAGHLGGLGVGLVLGWGWSSGRSGAPMIGAVGAAVLLAGALAAALMPEWRPAYAETKGYFLLERGSVAEAVPLLDAALALDPENAGRKNAVAYALAEAGVELPRARDLALEALDDEPDNPDYLDTLGWAYCRMGLTKQGLQHIRRADELTESSEFEIHGHIASCPAAGTGS